MQSSGLISTYNHTWSHHNVAGASLENLSQEILTADEQLNQYLGQNIKIFAYPYGGVSTNTINFLKENGFIAALSTKPGKTQCDSFIMDLHRTRIGNSHLSAYGL